MGRALFPSSLVAIEVAKTKAFAGVMLRHWPAPTPGHSAGVEQTLETPGRKLRQSASDFYASTATVVHQQHIPQKSATDQNPVILIEALRMHTSELSILKYYARNDYMREIHVEDGRPGNAGKE